MAESLKKPTQAFAACGVLLLSLGISAQAIAADILPDPTRPPVFVDGAGNSGAVPSGPVLQSVLIAAGRRIAVISGQTVQVGDKVGALRVNKITETEVVLSNGNDVQTLKLFPGIEKSRSAGRAAVKANNRRQ